MEKQRCVAALRRVTQGEVVCVFGCGGDRDPKKRVTAEAKQPDPRQTIHSSVQQRWDADPKYKDALAKAPECVEMRAKLAKLIGQ